MSHTVFMGFPGSWVGKESTCNAGDPGSIPGSERSTGEGQGILVFLPGESHGQRSLSGYSPWNSPGQNTAVGSISLLQGVFPTQGLNPGLPHAGNPSLPKFAAKVFALNSVPACQAIRE